MGSEEIKIRTLPRSNETKKKGDKDKASSTKSPRWIIYVGTLSLLAFSILLIHKPHHAAVLAAKKVHRADMASTSANDVNELVTKHLQDAEIKHTMMQHTREMENLQFRSSLAESKDDVVTLPDNHGYAGVQMDNEDSAGQVYDDLNENPAKFSDSLPEDKINSRLAHRKWLNEQEREEKIAFVKDYIREAYDRGYQVEINQDLVVTGVRKINGTKKLNINEVMDRLAQQGSSGM